MWLKCIRTVRLTRPINMLIVHLGNFLSGSVVKNLPCNAGDLGSIPGRGSKAPHTSEELSLCVATTEPMCHN